MPNARWNHVPGQNDTAQSLRESLQRLDDRERATRLEHMCRDPQ
jgi:hypothetical protein